MTVSLIVAVAENGVIGRDNQLPWHIPEDLKYFKRVTLGKPIVMGRKTYESIGRPLPGRPNLVVTRNPDWRADGVEAFSSLEAALASRPPDDEIMVIGGAELFARALPLAQRLYLTEIHRAYDGDVFFPTVCRADWREISREQQSGDPSFSFVQLQRSLT